MASLAVDDELPRRARRKAVTPVTITLAAATTGGGPPGAGAASDATTGTVSRIKGDVLYVKDADGNTIKVEVGSSATVERTATADAGKVHPGDTVIVSGKAAANGTVTAKAVTATQK